MRKYSKIVKGYLFTPLLFFVLLLNQVLAESHEKTYAKITERKETILSVSDKFDINPAYLSAIIYTERTKNYDWTDEAFDEVIARVGQNSSLGFSQVKMKTAYFIERQLSDSTSKFYCGIKYKGILEVSKSPFKLITKLQNDSLNILYAAAYLRMIQTFWSNSGYSIDDKPEIIGSLYQLGLFYPDGNARVPHFYPQANDFGMKTKEALNLFVHFNESEFQVLIE
ncbi:MAG: hypothetical protein KJ799_07145 [Bacteroidetes bacterium]|nr:hypothetical protein [Bacteroidota bacterium]